MPRSVLAAQIQSANQLGFTAQAASELEYYLLQESYEQAHSQHYHDLKAAGWYLEDYHIMQGSRRDAYHGELRRHLSGSGIPVESTKGEWGLGQHEINVVYTALSLIHI